MRIAISDAVAHIRNAPPAPVVLIDTCSLIDLFRKQANTDKPRVPVQEIQAAAELLELLTTQPNALHLIAPELVPREYADNAGGEAKRFDEWTASHDQNQEWLFAAARCVALTVPAPQPVQPSAIADKIRLLADNLIGKAVILDREQACLNRAVDRLTSKTRPSHKNQLKDSMNLEQCLELSRALENIGFLGSRIWVSSNTNDFAQGSASDKIHNDLDDDFRVAGLKYFTSIRAVWNQLRAAGEIP